MAVLTSCSPAAPLLCAHSTSYLIKASLLGWGDFSLWVYSHFLLTSDAVYFLKFFWPLKHLFGEMSLQVFMIGALKFLSVILVLTSVSFLSSLNWTFSWFLTFSVSPEKWSCLGFSTLYGWIFFFFLEWNANDIRIFRGLAVVAASSFLCFWFHHEDLSSVLCYNSFLRLLGYRLRFIAFMTWLVRHLIAVLGVLSTPTFLWDPLLSLLWGQQ